MEAQQLEILVLHFAHTVRTLGKQFIAPYQILQHGPSLEALFSPITLLFFVAESTRTAAGWATRWPSRATCNFSKKAIQLVPPSTSSEFAMAGTREYAISTSTTLNTPILLPFFFRGCERCSNLAGYYRNPCYFSSS